MPLEATEIVKILRTCKNLAVFENKWVFRKKKFNFFEIAKGKLFPVRSDWKGNKSPRNVQNKVFLSEVYGFFRKISCFF